jgi:pimeloyl-ACP methyl ester carboxylesterase
MTERISADDWFARGTRRVYDPPSGAMGTGPIRGRPREPLSVFERVVPAPGAPPDVRWTTLLPGFPDGSYGYAQVDTLLGSDVTPRLFIEYVGQGDSDKPAGYRYSTMERADLVEDQWAVHGVRTTFVVTIDYSSLVLLELLARQHERSARAERIGTRIESVFIVNGGLFADAHSHPWQTTPLLKTPAGRVGLWVAQRSPAVFARMLRGASLYSKAYGVSDAELREQYSAIARRDGAGFMHRAAGSVDEHRANAERWDLARLYLALRHSVRFHIAGSVEDPYEPRQIVAARERLGAYGLDVRQFPGGHMTTSEHPDLLTQAIRELARS